jgi:hypothetical protein
MGGADKIAIPWGNHSLSNRVEETVRAMISFIKKGGPKKPATIGTFFSFLFSS